MELSKDCLAKMKSLKKEEMSKQSVLESLLIELRPRLSSGNVLLQTNRTLTKMDFSSESSQILLTLKGEGWAEILLLSAPESFKFVPSGFKIDDNSVSFNIVFGPIDKRHGSISAEVLKLTHGKSVSQKQNDEYSIPDFPCQPKCHKCDYPVWEEWWKFDRVLPLPITPLEEVIGEWFCHGHSDSHTLAKRPSDCYYDSFSTFFYLNESPKRVVLCRKCSAWLGVVDKHSMCRLWGCTVKWVCDDGSLWVNCPDSPFEAFLKAVNQAVREEGQLKPIVKLSIQTQYSDKEIHWLVLYVLNGHLEVLLPPSEADYLEEEDILKEESGSEDRIEEGWHIFLSDILPDIKRVMDTEKSSKDSKFNEKLSFKVNLCSCLMTKVLFREEKDVSGLKDVLNSADVISIQVATPMFQAGLDHLLANNKLLPQRERFSDSFSVSYLEC